MRPGFQVPPTPIELWGSFRAVLSLAPWNGGARNHGGAPSEAPRESPRPNDSGKNLTAQGGGLRGDRVWQRQCPPVGVGFPRRWFWFVEFFCLWATES